MEENQLMILFRFVADVADIRILTLHDENL